MPLKTYSRKRMRTMHIPSDSTPSPSSDEPTAIAVEPTQIIVQGPIQLTASTLDDLLKSTSPRPRKRLKYEREEIASEPLVSTNAPQSLRRLKATRPSEKAKFRVFVAKDDDNRPTTFQNRTSGHMNSSAAIHQNQCKSENILFNPSVLGPPIRIPSPKIPRIRPITDHSSLIRRPSADTHNVHILTSAFFHRRPSGSHALQQKSQNRDWLAPIASRPATSRIQTKISDTSVAAADDHISKTHMLFRPQCSSTPLHTRFTSKSTSPNIPSTSIDGDDTTKPQLLTWNQNLPHTSMKDIIQEAKESACEARKPDIQTQKHLHQLQTMAISKTPRRVVHLSHDSIFSSFDISDSDSLRTSAPGHFSPPTNALENKAFQQNKDIPSIENEETTMKVKPLENVKLHDMFSGLELADGTGKTTLTFQDSGIIDAPMIENQPMNLRNEEDNPESHDRRKRSKTALKFQGDKTAKARGKRHSKKGRADKGAGRGNPLKAIPFPKPVLIVNDEPLVGNGDDDDELLLTSKGWDWDPR